AQPRRDLVLSWGHFSDAAHEAGLSRRYGGIHLSQGDVDARATGRRGGVEAWQKAVRYFSGAAHASTRGRVTSCRPRATDKMHSRGTVPPRTSRRLAPTPAGPRRGARSSRRVG